MNEPSTSLATIEEDSETTTQITTQNMLIARAEIDQQTATARAWPRSMSRAKMNLMNMVQLDKLQAEKMSYALPIGDSQKEGKRGKAVTGPSIRFAEAVKAAWGNNSGGARTTDINKDQRVGIRCVEAEGVFIDFETNTRTTIRHQRRIFGKDGRTFNDHLILVTAAAAQSIAFREAILKGIPRTFWGEAYDMVQQFVKGDAKTLVERRQLAVTAFANFGVGPERVYKYLEVQGIEDIGLDDLPALFAIYQSIKSGEGTVEEWFPKEGEAGRQTPNGKNPLKDDEIQKTTETTLKDQPQQAHSGPEPKVEQSEAEKPRREPGGNVVDAALKATKDEAAKQFIEKGREIVAKIDEALSPNPKPKMEIVSQTDVEAVDMDFQATRQLHGQQGDVFPGDLPMKEAIDKPASDKITAFALGKKAYNDGKGMRSMPDGLTAAEVESWKNGYNEAKALRRAMEDKDQ